MLRYLLPCFAIFVSTSAVSAAPKLSLPAGVKLLSQGSSYPGAPEVYKFELANGVKVLVLPDDRNPVAMFRLIMNAGSNREVKGETGLAHFFEHMMFRKSKSTPEGHYDRTLAGVGGSGNAGTSTDYVVYYSKFPGPALDKMLEVESQRFLELELKEPYFSTEKGAVISERFMRLENNPQQRGVEIIRSIVERDTPYEWMVIGSKDDVKNMSLSAAQKFYENFYTPDNALISVGGPFDVSTAIQKVNTAFGGWKGKMKPQAQMFNDAYFTRMSGKSLVCSELVNESHYQVMYPSKATSYNDNLMAQVLTQMLNNHPEGTVQRRLLKAKLGTQFYIYKNNSMRQSQPVVAYFALNKEQKIADTLRFWNESLQWVMKQPIDNKFKSRLTKQTEVSQADLSQKMTNLLEEYEWNDFVFGNFLAAKQDLQLMKNLTTQNFRAWVKSNLIDVKPYLTGIVPNGSAKPCAQLTAADIQNMETTNAK